MGINLREFTVTDLRHLLRPKMQAFRFTAFFLCFATAFSQQQVNSDLFIDGKVCITDKCLSVDELEYLLSLKQSLQTTDLLRLNELQNILSPNIQEKADMIQQISESGLNALQSRQRRAFGLASC
jgi:hypothetical protein